MVGIHQTIDLIGDAYESAAAVSNVAGTTSFLAKGWEPKS